MPSQKSYPTLPPVDMRPAKFFMSLTTEQLIEHLRWAGEIVADDLKTGHRSMVQIADDMAPMPVSTYVKALRFQLHRREYHNGRTPIDAGNGGAV